MVQPALIVVHGAWHVPEHYSIFMNMLRDDGYEVHSPHLPSCGDLASQSDLSDDVRTVRELLLRLVQEEKKEVIVIAHSYGGAVAADALCDMSHEERKTKGLLGGVIHLIYMCAFMLQPGESAFSAGQPRPDPDPVEPGDDGTSFLCQSPKELFYADVDDDLARECEALLVRHSIAALTGNITYPAWQHIPSTYLVCTEDRVLFPDWQQRLVKAVQEKATIEVHTFKASHSPYLSMPREMVAVVQGVVAQYN